MASITSDHLLPRPGQGTGLGLGGHVLPSLEQQPVPAQSFSLGITNASNGTAVLTNLTVFQCLDGYNPQPGTSSTTARSPTPSPRWRTQLRRCLRLGGITVNATGNPTQFYLNTNINDQDETHGRHPRQRHYLWLCGATGIGIMQRVVTRASPTITDGLGNTVAVEAAAHRPLPDNLGRRGDGSGDAQPDRLPSAGHPPILLPPSARIPEMAPPTTMRIPTKPCASATATPRTSPTATTRYSTPIRFGPCTRVDAVYILATTRYISSRSAASTRARINT